MDINYLTSGSTTSKAASKSLDLGQATELMVERAKQLVNQLIEDRGHANPPFLAEEFARLLGFKVVRAELGKASAILLRFHDGYVIKVNENHHPARQNFSCAHEIGHTLFNDLGLEQYTNNIEYRTFDPQGGRKARAEASERLCDAAATELLMPETIFEKYLSGFGVSMHSVGLLANTFRVSVQAAAIRIAEISTEPCIAILWSLPRRTNSKALRLVWRIGPGRKSKGKDNYRPVHTGVKYPSILHKAYRQDNVLRCRKLFRLDNTVKRVQMESKGFGYNENRYVMSLAFPDRN